mgnify:CR=1 FL=1
MIYLIFAILFSASLALALRISETFSDNRYGILVGNYVTCLVVAFILLPDKNIFAAGSRTAVLTGIVNGFLFTGNLVLMQKCIRENGAVLSSAFAKLGIVIPVTASILFLGEIPTLFQLVGIVLVIVAIWVINSEGDRGCGRRRRMGSAGLLLVLFVVSGMADVKYMDRIVWYIISEFMRNLRKIEQFMHSSSPVFSSSRLKTRRSAGYACA